MRRQAQLFHSETSSQDEKTSRDSTDGSLSVSPASRTRKWLTPSRLWKPLTFSDVEQALEISGLEEHRTAGSSGTESEDNRKEVVLPERVARRRPSLGDILQTFKTKLVHDRPSPRRKSGSGHGSGHSSDHSWEPVEPLSSPVSSPEPASPEPTSPATLRHPDPPRIEVLADLPSNNLHRSSTFRTYLEKAANDINDKYGSVRSLPGSKTLRRRPALPSDSSSSKYVPIPPRSYFRPRDEPNAPEPPISIIVTPPSDDESRRDSVQLCEPTVCRHHKSCSRIPARQIERILEESLLIRDPPECLEPGIIVLKSRHDLHLHAADTTIHDAYPLPAEGRPSSISHQSDIIISMRSPSPSPTIDVRPETLQDVTLSDSSYSTSDDSDSSWIYQRGPEHEYYRRLMLRQGFRNQDPRGRRSPRRGRSALDTPRSLETHPGTPSLKAMSVLSSATTLHLPPSVAAGAASGTEDNSDLLLDFVDVERLAAEFDSIEESSASGSSDSKGKEAVSLHEAKSTTTKKDWGSNCEGVPAVESFVAYRRRLFERGSSYATDDSSSDESMAFPAPIASCVPRPKRIGLLGSEDQ